ncbi:MAG TPA: acetyl-CoA carboxylase carboxyltransferase subunit alpha [Pirellulales bacterium]|jgi:acetyl-CoA carboxylase carboxyl transferase subunit alpha|nr:acetyl-CoA carboxylase carboxyltransferase subunit alpha [Pirellulales bacterium]
MPTTLNRLAFEKPIYELEEKVAALEAIADKNAQHQDELRQLRREVSDLKKKIFANLDSWQTVEVARHPDRPMTTDYLALVFDEFVELHGDRTFGDDQAIRTGFAKIGQYKVLIVGQQKGKTLKERNVCNFGMPHPEGFRKAMSKMRLAAKYGLPVICLVDTPGAYPGIGAEERGISLAIAESMFLMSQLPTPIICVVIGEGSSGGALGIGLGDKVAVLEHAYYSVIGPEGCAGILWKSGEFKKDAAKALRLTARDLLKLGVIDDVIEEPIGGAHRDHHQMALRLKIYLLRGLRDLVGKPSTQLLNARYEKFRRMGVFLESGLSSTTDAAKAFHGGLGDGGKKTG